MKVYRKAALGVSTTRRNGSVELIEILKRKKKLILAAGPAICRPATVLNERLANRSLF